MPTNASLRRSLGFWANLLGYQGVWFLLVSGAARSSLVVPIAAAVAFVVVQLIMTAEPRSEGRLVVAALLLGSITDGVAAALDWLRYASPAPALPPQGAPLWILMLWASFATTINRSLTVVRGRPWLAAVLGGLGAPLAYSAAASGWHAVEWTSPWAWVWIGACWAFALPILVWVNASSTQGQIPRSE
ncbi:DUF2878 domain-containing protein [Luteibacter flocculans]|uniref:DUF2878 domain-containing protein n=1 Tax=Luteibacter flocculans TaxID=2780091 RepID=A0ABY4TBC0_9GAMM|nr:DUF2878 domain-containing protein [Luteibacter flocculans]URL60189.1 DUF2878 domain-containing protein [Luteibacter flocculans]